MSDYFITDIQVTVLSNVQNTIHQSCVAGGWYNDLETGEPIERNFGEVVALMHLKAIVKI